MTQSKPSPATFGDYHDSHNIKRRSIRKELHDIHSSINISIAIYTQGILLKTNDGLAITQFREEHYFGAIHSLESWRSQSKATQCQRWNIVWNASDDVEKGKESSKPVVSMDGRAGADSRSMSC